MSSYSLFVLIIKHLLCFLAGTPTTAKIASASPSGATIFVALQEIQKQEPQRGDNNISDMAAPLGLASITHDFSTNITAPLGLNLKYNA
jgi:hypothetical protein